MRFKREVESAELATHGGLVEQVEREKDTQVLDFSANLNPLGPPSTLGSTIFQALPRIERYPDNTYKGFREAAAEYAGVPPDCIVPANGSTEYIRLIAESLLRRGDKVIIPTPTFSEYEANARIFGARVDHVSGLEDAELSGARLAFLCNPNNPTGELKTRSEVIGFVERCRDADVAVFVDEAFIELSSPRDSVARVAAEEEGVFVLRSLTKSYAIPGLRVGFGVCHPDHAERLNAARLHWNLGVLPAHVGTVFMRHHQDHVNKARRVIQKETPYLRRELRRLGFEPRPTNVNFILADTSGTGMSPGEIVDELLERGDVLVRDCASFDLPECIRVAVRTHPDNRRLIESLEGIVGARA